MSRHDRYAQAVAESHEERQRLLKVLGNGQAPRRGPLEPARRFDWVRVVWRAVLVLLLLALAKRALTYWPLDAAFLSFARAVLPGLF